MTFLTYYLARSFHFFLFLSRFALLRDLHSFPTRRSSDLAVTPEELRPVTRPRRLNPAQVGKRHASAEVTADRKSTRLNSSHTVMSYAVFRLKKKKMQMTFWLCANMYPLGCLIARSKSDAA